MKEFLQQPTPVPPQVELPPDFPDIPAEVIERFPSAVDWQRRLDEFWTRTQQAIQQAQDQTARQVNANVVYTVDTFRINVNGVPTPMFTLDSTGIKLGDVLVVSTAGRKVFIGAGAYEDADTPFYVDTLGFFSLGDSLTWNPDTDTLTVNGIINATSGTIGGFDIGADYIRDTANSFGLASTVTGGDDVRFWAGDTFANRATAPFRIYESGVITVGQGASYQYNNVRMISGITALDNFFFGPSGNFTMSGSGNFAAGNGAFIDNTIGDANTAVGSNVLANNTTGSANIAIGGDCMAANTTGFGNTAFGLFALTANERGGYNVAIGADAMLNNVDGSSNVAIGYAALNSLNPGNIHSYNVAVGINCGQGITTGVNNTIIGARVTGLSGTLSNNIILAIGDGTIKARYNSTWTLSDGLDVTGALSADSLDSTPIGAISPSTGAFTTLSATGQISTTATGAVFSTGALTGSAKYASFANTAGTAEFGILASGHGYAGTTSADDFDIYVNGSTVGAFSSTGLAVTGTLSATGVITAGNGAASTNAALIIDGASTNNFGAILFFRRAGVTSWRIGHTSAISGGASSDLAVYDETSGAVRSTFSTTGLSITGGLTVSGLAGVGTRNVVVDAAGVMSAP